MHYRRPRGGQGCVCMRGSGYAGVGNETTRNNVDAGPATVYYRCIVSYKTVLLPPLPVTEPNIGGRSSCGGAGGPSVTKRKLSLVVSGCGLEAASHCAFLQCKSQTTVALWYSGCNLVKLWRSQSSLPRQYIVYTITSAQFRDSKTVCRNSSRIKHLGAYPRSVS